MVFSGTSGRIVCHPETIHIDGQSENRTLGRQPVIHDELSIKATSAAWPFLRGSRLRCQRDRPSTQRPAPDSVDTVMQCLDPTKGAPNQQLTREEQLAYRVRALQSAERRSPDVGVSGQTPRHMVMWDDQNSDGCRLFFIRPPPSSQSGRLIWQRSGIPL